MISTNTKSTYATMIAVADAIATRRVRLDCAFQILESHVEGDVHVIDVAHLIEVNICPPTHPTEESTDGRS